MTEYVTVWRDGEPTKLRWGIPIARCRDCKHAANNGYSCTFFGRREYVGSYRWEDVPAEVEPDGFCAWGKRAGDA